MLEHHSHMLTDFINVNLGVCDILSVEPDFTTGRSLQQVQAT